MSNLENANIDFVIETLFYSYQKEENANVRKAALISLDILHKRSKKLQIEYGMYKNIMVNCMHK